jgi:hypothetical protein
VAHGVGLGYEPLPDVLRAGMTLSLRAEVDGWVRRDIVRVTGGGADLLL